jgi:hypothetical protein
VLLEALPPAEPHGCGGRHLGHKGVYQGGLANARFPGNPDHLTVPPEGGPQTLVEVLHLGLAGHKRRRQPPTGERHRRRQEDRPQRRGRDGWLHGADRRNEAIAPPMQRLDAALLPPTVTNGLACRHDAVVQRHLANELVGPELFQEFVPCDHPLTMLDEVAQDVKHLRFEPTRLAGVAQLIQAGVEFVLSKDVAHRLSPSAD